MQKFLFVVFMITVAGCASEHADATHVEANAAGITTVSVERQAGRTAVVGFDAAGVAIASATLRVGNVHYSLDEGESYVDGFGRDLLVQVADEPSFQHLSPGTADLQLPAPQSAKTAAFLAIPTVAGAFEGVRFGAAPAGTGLAAGEQAYGSASSLDNFGYSCAVCAYARSTSCGTNTCARHVGSGGAEGEYVCCAGTHVAVDRLCVGAAGSTNNCGTVGPLGCSVCWTSSYTTSCTADYTFSYNPTGGPLGSWWTANINWN